MEIIKDLDLKEDFFSSKEVGEIGIVKEILNNVKRFGDKAVSKYTKEFDGVELDRFRVDRDEVIKAYKEIDEDGISTLKLVTNKITKFAKKQLEQLKDFEYKIEDGVITGQKLIPIGRLGIYVPGGRFPLASSLLMCGVPATVAGVNEIAVCSPACYNKSVHPLILVACDILGVNEIYRIGGAQAIAAMAYGTKSIRKVDKIVGPGNKYVNLAKKEVYGTVGIDFIAGSTELIIIADKWANPLFIASDLIAQAEHDNNAVPILLTDSEELANEVKIQVEKELKKSSESARQSIDRNGKIVLVKSIDTAIDIANRIAPEHVELQVVSSEKYIGRLCNYGSLFIGDYSAEVLGDYSSGLNHVLPTGGGARYTGGLSVFDFIKIQTTLSVTKDGFMKIAPLAKQFSKLEGLSGHLKSIDARV